jgi:hypothetical protein
MRFGCVVVGVVVYFVKEQQFNVFQVLSMSSAE